MDDNETYEVELDIEETEETEDGSFLATAAVFGVGALVGAGVVKGYGKAKEAVQTRLEARRARKTIEGELKTIETTATEAE